MGNFEILAKTLLDASPLGFPQRQVALVQLYKHNCQCGEWQASLKAASQQAMIMQRLKLNIMQINWIEIDVFAILENGVRI